MTSIFFDSPRTLSDINHAVFQLIAARDQLEYSQESLEKLHDETGAAILRMAVQAIGDIIKNSIEEISE